MSPSPMIWLSLLASSAPAISSEKPVVVGRAFLEAVISGDIAAIRDLRTGDALFGSDHMAGSMVGAEEALTTANMKHCTIGPLLLRTGKTDVNLLRDRTPPSIKAGNAATIEGSLSCPSITGAKRTTPVTVVVAGGRVALFGIR